MTEERTLPEGWRWVCFGDVVRQVKQSTKDPEKDGLTRIVGLDHLDSESLPVRRWDELEDLPDGTSFTRIFRAGQVLFGKRRAYQRKVGVADFDGVCSGDILVFEPSGDELLAEFLPYLVQSDEFVSHALSTSAGSLSPRTKWQELAKFEFGLPPIDEQVSIGRVLLAHDELATQYGRIVSSLVPLRLATFQDALTGPEMVRTAWGQTRDDSPVRLLGEICRVVRGSSPRPKGDPLYFASERTPHHWIMISDLSRSRVGKWLTDTEEFLTDLGVEKSRAVPAGTLLLTNCATVGVPVFAGIDGCIHDGFLAFDEFDSVQPAYLYRLFEFLTPWFRNIAQTGTQANLNTGILKSLEVPVLPASEQKRLTASLDELDEIGVAASDALDAARSARRATLTAMIGGSELT